jgi:S1-C subfamily serine protease
MHPYDEQSPASWPAPVAGWLPYGGYPPPPPSPPKRRLRSGVIAAAVVATVCAGTGIAVAVERGQTVSGIGVAAGPNVDRQSLPGSSGNSGNSGTNGGSDGNGSGGYGGFPFPGGSSGSSGSTSTGSATTAQSAGVVDIDTVLAYQGEEAAGTGMIVSSSGEVLTNNHVVQGATSIKVTVVSTGITYTASVVGTDASDDIAVLQLSGASGLTTAAFGDSSAVKVGDTVIGVGNAGGTGGTPSSATGHVTALDQQLTASDENGANSETLHGVIEIDAPIEAGDSGGPLYDSAGKIVGIDTAAETNHGVTTAAFAIPIDTALSIATQIESGQASSTVQLGRTGFLGVSVSDSGDGALIQTTVPNGPASRAGLVAGDVITAVNGTTVGSSAQLKSAMSTTKPGQQVSVTFADANGVSHHADVTLGTAPPA